MSVYHFLCDRAAYERAGQNIGWKVRAVVDA